MKAKYIELTLQLNLQKTMTIKNLLNFFDIFDSAPTVSIFLFSS